MEDKTFFSLVKFILIVYNLIVSTILLMLLLVILNAHFDGKDELRLFEGVALAHLFALNVTFIVVVVTISIIGLVAVFKEWYDLSMIYAIIEAIFLIVLVVLLVLFTHVILFMAITIAIQISITILAFGYAVAIRENKKIEKLKIQHNFV